MFYRYCGKFLEYCRLADFSDRSIQALEIRLGELRAFARDRKLKSIKDIIYLRLAAFTPEFNHPSVHVRKSRVWTLRQFYHFLSLHGYAKNVAKKLPYPKIDKTVPHFPTQDEYNRLICHFSFRDLSSSATGVCVFPSLNQQSGNPEAIYHINYKPQRKVM